MKKILGYYYDELLFLREHGKEFAQRYPTIADKIDFNGNRSNDPQTERIIESFAFMAAQLNAKIDDNAEDLAYYLLTGLYPEITAVFPPCSVVQFDNKNFNLIPRHTQIRIPTNITHATGEINDSYIFRTMYDLAVYPFQIAKLSINNTNELQIDIKTTSVPIDRIPVETILFYIDASILNDAIDLYATLFSTTPKVTIVINSQRYELACDALILCGFNEDETAVPVPKFTNYSFHLLREVLLFPQKFLFFKIVGIEKLIKQYTLKNIDKLSICIALQNTKIKIRKDSIRLNSVPVVNLFNYTTNSFRFDGTKSRYLLLSHKHPHLDIYSIKEVHLIDSQSKKDFIVPQYFSFDYNSLDNATNAIYWLQPLDEEHSAYISFIDTNMNPANVYADVAYAKTLCINKINPRSILSSEIIKTDTVRPDSVRPEGVKTDGANVPNVTGKVVLQITNPFWLEQHRSDIWNLLTQLGFGQLSKASAYQLVNKLRQIVSLYQGKYQSEVQCILDNIVEIEQVEANRRIVKNGHSCFVKAYTYNVLCKNLKIPPYATLFFKVLERYLQNNRPINSFLDVKVISTVLQ